MNKKISQVSRCSDCGFVCVETGKARYKGEQHNKNTGHRVTYETTTWGIYEGFVKGVFYAGIGIKLIN